jgi:hypothetical protein
MFQEIIESDTVEEEVVVVVVVVVESSADDSVSERMGSNSRSSTHDDEDVLVLGLDALFTWSARNDFFDAPPAFD